MSATVEKSVAGPVDRSLSKSDMSSVLATNREAGQLSQSLNIVSWILKFSVVWSSAGYCSQIYMTQLLLLGKFEYTGGPIFKVVLEC